MFQASQANASLAAFQAALTAAGYSAVTTEIIAVQPFYYAEDYHQQYLAKKPWRILRPGWYGRQLSRGVCYPRKRYAFPVGQFAGEYATKKRPD